MKERVDEDLEAKLEHLGSVLYELNESLEEERKLRDVVEKELSRFKTQFRTVSEGRIELEVERKLVDGYKKSLEKMKKRIDDGYYEKDGGIILDWISDDIKDALFTHQKARGK